MRRFVSLLAAVTATAAVWAEPALAHGLVGRADLPIPQWLFFWAAVIVLLVSFVALALAWRTPRFEKYGWRPLPKPLSRLITGRIVEVLAGLIGAALFAVTIWSGIFGAQNATKNFAPTFVYVIFWVGLVPVSILFGDIFKAFNPWRALASAVASFARLLSGGELPHPMPYPKRLGRWPAAVGIAGFAWLELAFSQGQDPSMIAIAILAYTALTFFAMSVFGIEAWIANGEAFSVMFNLLSRISIWERREGVMGVRPPLAGLSGLKELPGTVPLLAVMIGTISFDGASEGPLWVDLGTRLVDAFNSIGLGESTSHTLAYTVGILVAVVLVYGFYMLGIRGARTVGGDLTTRQLAQSFVHSLVPIAAVYSIAHYVSFLVFQGQAFVSLSSDPLGKGWDLFGTVSSKIDFSLLGANDVWYIQVAALVTGHVCGLVLAHERALILYQKSHVATRSQYWMLVVMIGFTSLGLWLLSQANA